MRKISDTEYVVVDKKNKTIRLWHECPEHKTNRNAGRRIELNVQKVEGGKSNFSCPVCGYEREIEVGLLLK